MEAMRKIFNVSGDCKPKLHYMVNIDSKLAEIKKMVSRGDYFTINRARQYGKTTTLKALERYLQEDYAILHLDFQKLSHQDFETEPFFVESLSREILKKTAFRNSASGKIADKIRAFACGTGSRQNLASLFACFSEWCEESKKPVVLMIDEVDSAASRQVFLDFLAQLRGYYIDRDEAPIFHSVILAGVYDIKNMKLKIRSDEEHTRNSPWNIAADFCVNMSFSPEEIGGMLEAYEKDYGTGMRTEEIAALLFDYTGGYPYLVSRICKLLDERVAGSAAFPGKNAAWTKAGVWEAVKLLQGEKNTLFESLVNKLADYTEIRSLIYALLFQGTELPFHSLSNTLGAAVMFGFIREDGGKAVIANRIFETVLYHLFLTEEAMKNESYHAALLDRNRFVKNGRLDMRRVLQKFVVHFNDIFGDQGREFYEEEGRRHFLLYLKPIINGTGNYYIEARTRNQERTDVIVDYGGEQFIIELKIWRGNAYNERGEKQLADYLDYYHLKKGYMISFNFNKKKQAGVQEILLGDRLLIEAIV